MCAVLLSLLKMLILCCRLRQAAGDKNTGGNGEGHAETHYLFHNNGGDLGLVVNIVFPVVGVLMLKSMRKVGLPAFPAHDAGNNGLTHVCT